MKLNKKLAGAGAAGITAIALAAGGLTFAAWSDFGEVSTGAGAGILKLNIDQRGVTAGSIQPFSLAPGQNKYQEFYLASADADNVPVGALTGKIINLVDTEDGGPACTTNSEDVAEGGTGDCGTAGELSSNLKVQILASSPVSNPTVCSGANIGPQGPYNQTNPTVNGRPLADLPADTYQLGNLSKGQGLCVRVEMSLPASVGNETQGDEVSFDWRFDLTQVP